MAEKRNNAVGPQISIAARRPNRSVQRAIVIASYVIGLASATQMFAHDFAYTVITNDMENHLAKHANGTGAKYTRGRGPYKIVYTKRHRTKGRALKREAYIKSVSRSQKLKLLS